MEVRAFSCKKGTDLKQFCRKRTKHIIAKKMFLSTEDAERMRKKSVIVLLAALAAFLLLTSGYFLGRRTVRGVRVSAEDGVPARELTALSTQAETETERLNINTATVEQLTQLPQIGEVIAQRIVDYRTQHGPFSAVSELLNVEGIGQSRYEAIRDYITVR